MAAIKTSPVACVCVCVCPHTHLHCQVSGRICTLNATEAPSTSSVPAQGSRFIGLLATTTITNQFDCDVFVVVQVLSCGVGWVI